MLKIDFSIFLHHTGSLQETITISDSNFPPDFESSVLIPTAVATEQASWLDPAGSDADRGGAEVQAMGFCHQSADVAHRECRGAYCALPEDRRAAGDAGLRY